MTERIAIEIFRQIILRLGNPSTTTRRLIEKILAKEEEHAEHSATLLARLLDNNS